MPLTIASARVRCASARASGASVAAMIALTSLLFAFTAPRTANNFSPPSLTSRASSQRSWISSSPRRRERPPGPELAQLAASRSRPARARAGVAHRLDHPARPAGCGPRGSSSPSRARRGGADPGWPRCGRPPGPRPSRRASSALRAGGRAINRGRRAAPRSAGASAGWRLAVVGQQDQSGRVRVEAPDRIEAGRRRPPGRRRPAAGLGSRAVESHAGRLVHDPHFARLGASRAVDYDAARPHRCHAPGQ